MRVVGNAGDHFSLKPRLWSRMARCRWVSWARNMGAWRREWKEKQMWWWGQEVTPSDGMALRERGGVREVEECDVWMPVGGK